MQLYIRPINGNESESQTTNLPDMLAEGYRQEVRKASADRNVALLGEELDSKAPSLIAAIACNGEIIRDTLG